MEQELVMDLVRRMSAYDHERASQNTFMARVIEHRAASLIAMATAPIRNGGRLSLSWEWLLESGHTDGMHTPVDASHSQSINGSEAMVVALDLSRCLQRLSWEQKRLCQMLPFKKPSAISREMGWSRATFFRRMANLREAFRQFGLENFFEAA
ncbi:MAG: hypothetical protein HQL64_15710 [Magnetococcales bacterium]|nr:hypothetical protein [Magnetococcales bacterium]